MGDDPMHVMMRQIMALFDEYQSKEMRSTSFARSRKMPGKASGTARCRRSDIAWSMPSNAARR
jgi:hypothetical protein